MKPSRASNSRLAAFGLLFTLLATADSPARAADAEDGAVVLEDMTITPSPAPLDASLVLLRKLLERSAPCMGCDAVLLPRREDPALTLVKYLFLPSTPPVPDDAARLASEARRANSVPEIDRDRR
jgi:hypothetical protein